MITNERLLDLRTIPTQDLKLLGEICANQKSNRLFEDNRIILSRILVPRSLAVLVKVSRELIDDSVNIEQALEAALRGSLSVELDRVAWIRNAARAERHQVHLRHKLIGHGGRPV